MWIIRKEIVILGVLSCIWLLGAWLFQSAHIRPAVQGVNGDAPIPRIAIVIDDFGGDDRQGVKALMELPIPVTVAVMPFQAFTRQDASDAAVLGQQVIIHLPMESNESIPWSWYGPKPILLSHTYEEAKQITNEAIADMPEAGGINIHMGSGVSENEILVQAVMDACLANDLFFLDSYTSVKSVCEKVASKQGTPFLRRDIFLENGHKNKDYILNQLRTAAQLAQVQGDCVVIGHAGPEGGTVTAEAIRDILPYFEKEGIQLTFARDLIH
jgi:polysaccharide deacetylase 2 family uncharacterized protein YibQ